MYDFGITDSTLPPWGDYMKNIVSVIINEGVTYTGANAFRNASNLKYVSLADSVTKIGNGCFHSCKNLVTLDLNNVTHIGNKAFNGCSFASVDLSNVIKIGEKAFYMCGDLYRITLGDDLVSVGSNAFNGCCISSQIYFGKSLVSIGEDAFYNNETYSFNVHPDNIYYTSVDGVLFNKDMTTLLRYPPYKEDIQVYFIPDTVTTIYDYAFYNNEYLMDIAVPSSVTKIGEDAFSSCEWLTNIYYYGSKEEWKLIEKYEIGSSLSIKYVVSNPDITYTLENGVLTIKGNGTLSDYTDVIPAPWYPFSESITKIIIEEGIEAIKGQPFIYLKNVEELSVPSTLKEFGSFVFYYCTKLNAITYNGARSDFSAITVGRNNEPFANIEPICTYVYIHYDVNGGENTPDSIKVPCNTSVTLSDIMPQKAGYIFMGWSTQSGDIYAPREAFNAGDEDITLSAIWKSNISLEVNITNGTHMVTPVNVPSGSSIIFAYYNGDTLSEMIPYTYTTESAIPFTATKSYDNIKIFVWKSLESLEPLCAPITEF